MCGKLRRCGCYEGLAMRRWCVAENAAQWPFGRNPSKSMDLLRVVCMDAYRHRQTDRGRHRHGHSFHVADGVGPANKTYQNMTDQGRTEQEKGRAGEVNGTEVKPWKKPRLRLYVTP